MAEPMHRFVETNGIRMHIAELGSGPLVLLCHGFPESWYSWRHQLRGLAEGGYHAVAPDMRGYGQTDRPDAIDQYTLLHLVGDMVGLVDALGEQAAVIVGHDWGAPVAWTAALLRPDRFRGVVGLSVPFLPRGPARPTSLMPQTDDAVFYQLYFQTPGVAEADYAHDVRAFIRTNLFVNSGDGPMRSRVPGSGPVGMVPRVGGLRARWSNFAVPETLPAWCSEADVDFYAGEFSRSGFGGGLNYYRNIDRNWELLAPLAGAQVPVPALYIVGQYDLVLAFDNMRKVVANLTAFVPCLRATIVLPGCGHWTQQERPAEVNAALLGFLRAVGQRDPDAESRRSCE
ncbi:MAG TPA: alpha/beta hydrolase [Acetobacteraceae bacterium]|nr:alpha/beta hydrolase [Acetobacteraceae bacterium]